LILSAKITVISSRIKVFVLPLLLLPLILLRGRRNFAEVRRPENRTASVSLVPAGGEGRESGKQQGLDGVIALVSDGVNCCRVSVSDLSQRDICFACPVGGLNKDSDRMGVLLTGAGESVHMQVRPRWKLYQGSEQNIGATIVETLGNWKTFTDIIGKSKYRHAG